MNLLSVQRVSLIVTKNCTLRCKLCGALAQHIPYGSYNPAFEVLADYIARFFKAVKYSGIIDISGGEPLLRSVNGDDILEKILLFIVKEYKNAFGMLRIFTNGTIIPDDSLCKTLAEISKHKPFKIIVDNYGECSANALKASDKLKTYGIEHEVRDYFSENMHCNGWVNLLDISEKNNKEAAAALFKNCAIPQKSGCCLEILNGVISPCSVAATRYICNQADMDSEDIVDLFCEPSEIVYKLNKILRSTCFESCAYCDGGMTDNSSRYMPGEQATLDEIKDWNSKYHIIFEKNQRRT